MVSRLPVQQIEQVLIYYSGVCFNQKISGYYHPGTFQQYAIGPASYVTPIPESLPSDAAAPMLCAGVTVYSALRKSSAKAGDWVAILGAGGGLGTYTYHHTRGQTQRKSD